MLLQDFIQILRYFVRSYMYWFFQSQIVCKEVLKKKIKQTLNRQNRKQAGVHKYINATFVSFLKMFGHADLCIPPHPFLLRLCLSSKLFAWRGLHHAKPAVTRGVGLQCVISFYVSDPYTRLFRQAWGTELFAYLTSQADITHFYYLINTGKMFKLYEEWRPRRG